MRAERCAIFLAFLIWGSICCSVALLGQETCWLDTPVAYQRQLGGNLVLGPYSSRDACEEVRTKHFYDAGSCRCEQNAPAPEGSDVVRLELPAASQAIINHGVEFYMAAKQLDVAVAQSTIPEPTRR